MPFFRIQSAKNVRTYIYINMYVYACFFVAQYEMLKEKNTKKYFKIKLDTSQTKIKDRRKKKKEEKNKKSKDRKFFKTKEVNSGVPSFCQNYYEQ